MSAAVDPSELRLIRGFQAKDGDAKSTNVEMVELDNAIRLTTNDDAHVVLTPAQASHMADTLYDLVHRVEARRGQE